jgi:pimeloyl-ACP methyl ester carboxylesterase
MFIQEWGNGDTVVALHASLASGAAWSGVASALGSRWHVIAPDFHGDGRTPRALATIVDDELARDTELAVRLLQMLGGRIHLVGHSYGAVIAARAATILTRRVASLTLIEPVSFELLWLSEARALRKEIQILEAKCRSLLASNAAAEATKLFVSYWASPEIWERAPETERLQWSLRMPKVLSTWRESFESPSLFSQLQDACIPLLLIGGTYSPAPTQFILRAWKQALRSAKLVNIRGASHMVPLSHARETASELERFWQEIALRSDNSSLSIY